MSDCPECGSRLTHRPTCHLECWQDLEAERAKVARLEADLKMANGSLQQAHQREIAHEADRAVLVEALKGIVDLSPYDYLALFDRGEHGAQVIASDTLKKVGIK